MIVKKALEATLHNLKIEREKTEKTIQITQSFLNDLYNKKDQLDKDIYEADHSLFILEMKEKPLS